MMMLNTYVEKLKPNIVVTNSLKLTLPKGKNLCKLKNIFYNFISKLLDNCLYHQPYAKSKIKISNDLVVNYITISYTTTLLLGKYNYMSMLLKGIKKVKNDILYYAKNFWDYTLNPDYMVIQITPQNKHKITFSGKSNITYLFSKKRPPVSLSEEEFIHVISKYKNKKVKFVILIWYEP